MTNVIALPVQTVNRMDYAFEDWHGEENGREGPEGNIVANLYFGGIEFVVSYDFEKPDEYSLGIEDLAGYANSTPHADELYDQYGTRLHDAIKQAQERLSKHLYDRWEAPERCHKDYFGWGE